jgi:leucyl aminopeptidase
LPQGHRLTVGFDAAAPWRDAVAIAAPSPEAAALLARVGPHRFKDEPEDVLPVLTESGWRVVVGLGPAADLTPRQLRRIGGALFGELADSGIVRLSIALDLSPAEAAELAYGMVLRAWRPAARYRSKPDPEKEWSLAQVTLVVTAPPTAAARFARLAAVAEGARFARDLVVAPGNELTPTAFVERLSDIKDVALNVIDPARAGLALLQAVGQGSAHPPRLAVLHWQGAGRHDAPAAFVGKGITFDTGGIDIKPRRHMEEMKTDMAGAAAVAGVLKALAARRAPVNAVGVLALAENMPSARATRPGDVVKGFSGQTVEIIDTDAEGRLALADGLAYTAATCRPAWMVDLATLTGAVEVTLGSRRAGLFTADESLAARLLAAGEAEDELLWRLPLTDFYDEALKSPIADLRNCQWERGPDALHAARFLQHFVPARVPWAHLDIAGMAVVEEDRPLASEGPTGFGVRLLDRLVADAFEG